MGAELGGSVTDIAGVGLHVLAQIEDNRGGVLHMLRCDSPLFERFGEVYFSITRPGVVKAWKRHKEMTQHFAVPMGRMRIVIFDDRQDASSRGLVREVVLGRPDAYCLLKIPPMLWYGFEATGGSPGLIANVADLPHRPDESEKGDMADPYFPQVWGRECGT